MNQPTGQLKETKPIWLIVEDDPSVRQLLVVMMQLWGVQPLDFADGNLVMKWLDQLERDPRAVVPELALLDVRLPGPHGHIIAQRLRQIPATAQMAIVMMSAFHFRADELAMIKQVARPQLIISKPLPTPNDLKALLEQAARTPVPDPV